MSYETAPATVMLAAHCACCGRPLVDALSVELGIGPECRARHGYDVRCAPEARARANAIVHAIALDQAPARHAPELEELRALGFVALAARIAQNAGHIDLRRVNGCVEVSAPYSADAVGAWRAIPGRRWDGAVKRNIVPASSAQALSTLLADCWPGGAVYLDGLLVGIAGALPAGWLPTCPPPAAAAVVGGAPAAAAPRAFSGSLDVRGVVRMAYDPRALPVLRAMPGARWDREQKVWRVSTRPADRGEVLAAARQLGLAIAPELEACPAASEADSARDRARAAGLYPYQVEGVGWLCGRARALLADEPGLGKTAQVLLALPAQARCIVICPASIKLVWRDECRRWRPELAPIVLAGSGSFRLPEPGELVILNYDILDDDLAAPGCTVIIDEAHACKSHRAARAKRCAALVKSAERGWLLTGTPMLGKPFDLWGVLRTGQLERDAFGGWHNFLALFGGQPGKWGGYVFAEQPDPSVPGRLRRVMLRRDKATVLPQLPPITYQDLAVNALSPELRTLLDAVEREHGEAVARGELPPFAAMSRARALLAKERISPMLEIVEQHEEADQPLVVFSAHRAPIDALRAREGWAVVTGSESAEQRADTVRRFQAGELRGIGLTIQAGGVGITLTRASRVLFVDLDWTPALNQQAVDRVHRIGQAARGVLVMRLVSEHALDRRVHEVLVEKGQMIAATIEAAAREAP